MDALRTRTALIGLLTALATVALSSVASAGTYDVTSCSTNAQQQPPTRVTGVDDAWTTETNDPTHYEFVVHCPPATIFDNDQLPGSGADVDGLVVQSRLNTAGAPLGTFGQWRFDAPLGTSVTRLRLWRETGKAENTWQLYTRTAEGTTLAASDCFREPDSYTCQLGAPGDGPADWTGLSTSGVRIGYTCIEPAQCATGATLHEAWAAIYSAVVTVQDNQAPTASGATGSLLADGYLRGTLDATLASATDNTGIRSVQIRADQAQQLVAEAQRTCDYTRRIPCTNLTSPSTVSVDTTKLSDGPHTIAVGALDAAGNFTAATSKQVTIDNTAPAPPTPTSLLQQTVSAPSASVPWANPAGQVAPITTAHITVCGPSGCQTHTQPVSGAGGSATIALDAYGTYGVSVALEDAAGNFDASQATSWTIIFPTPTPPQNAGPTPAPPVIPTTAAPTPAPGPSTPTPTPTPTSTPAPAPAPTTPLANPRLTVTAPTVARDRRTITVHGTVAPRVAGQVTVSVAAKIRGRTRTVTRRATIRNRRYAVRLRLPSSGWRSATVTVRLPAGAGHRAARITRKALPRKH